MGQFMKMQGDVLTKFMCKNEEVANQPQDKCLVYIPKMEQDEH